VDRNDPGAAVDAGWRGELVGGVVSVNDTTTSETRLDTSFNEYCSVGGTSVTHDANGSLTNNVRF